ncbi:hypothetical protein [Siculibacillus lacustris]|nr:hypothetical protein [Siculibacillus lacustris]
MSSLAVPRPVLLIGTPILVLAFAGAVWAWVRWGSGVWFDTLAASLALCL